LAHDGVALRSSLIAGALAGLVAGLLFAVLHAIIIVPVWSRMVGGLLFGVAAGVTAGWAYSELSGESPARHSSARRGFSFGVLLFLAVVPVTLVDVVLRATGMVERHRDVTDAIAVGLAVLGGVTVAWIRAHRRRAIIAMGAASLCLTMAMGGPVPVGRNVRVVEIFLAVFAASIFAGTVLGAVEPKLRGLVGSRGAVRDTNTS
jgi:hypothetical protein